MKNFNNELLNSFANFGISKVNNEIYKKEIFFDKNKIPLTDKEKKSLRKKLRAQICELMKVAISLKNNEKELLNFVIEFDKYYQKVYNVNDYSVASIANGNISDTNKILYENGMKIIKEYKEKTTKKK